MWNLCSFVSVVNFSTRGRSCLDKVVLSRPTPDVYQTPVKLAPLACSDHSSILLKPKVNKVKNRVKPKKKLLRPIKDSSVRVFGQIITQLNWSNAISNSDPEKAAVELGDILQTNFRNCFPIVVSHLKEDDKPWFNVGIKKLIRKRHNAYRLGKDAEFRFYRNEVRNKIRSAKAEFYSKSIAALRNNEPRKWHKKIQTITGKAKPKFNTIVLNCDLPVHDVVRDLNIHFSRICSQLPALDLENLPAFLPSLSPPVIYPGEVYRRLLKIKVNKSSHPDDIPSRLIRDFAVELAPPLTEIFNLCLKSHVFPSVWKRAAITPIPKSSKACSPDEYRPISITPLFGRIFESFIAEWISKDFQPHLDPQQFGNSKGCSTTHYLVDLM
ncbi:uncharacterized protein [Antedon mediterranea]|uniref:uncharacterized protein n=1 Tax=Antedon mediterranea TaxID=105859 RepID=UPI003AF81258